MTSLSLLTATVPDWITICGTITSELRFSAEAQQPGGGAGRTYNLQITSNAAGKVSITEIGDNLLLPKCCPERHINPTGTFCVFYNSTHPLRSDEAAEKWWFNLGVYLNYQDHATKFKVWPIDGGLSHGDAADVQIEMEKDLPTGWRREVLEGIFRGQSWLGGNLPKSHKKSTKLLNGRTPCPRGCRHLHHPFRKLKCEKRQCNSICKKEHGRVLRVECPNRATVEKLVSLEKSRRSIEAKFMREIYDEGYRCCGTMKRCALADFG